MDERSEGQGPRSAKRFHEAVQRGDVDAVRAMPSAQPQLATCLDEDRFQPIHLLDVYPDAEILDLLLSRGADIGAPNDAGVTLLHIVADPDLVATLAARGAPLEARDRRGRTPLIMQAGERQNGPDVVAALPPRGANPNAKGDTGETALGFARETGDGELIALLVRCGARD